MTTASLTQNNDNNVNLVLVPENSSETITQSSVETLIQQSEFKHLRICSDNIKNAIAELNQVLKNLTPGTKGREISYEILERVDACVEFTLLADDMLANAKITSAQGGQHLSAKSILAAAQSIGVVKGFNKNALVTLAQQAANSPPGTTVEGIIAKGLEAKNGKDTRIKLLVESAQNRILKPKERDDGSVDMRDLGDIICVKVGEPLAKRIPYTLGSQGYTVTGNILEPLPGEDIPLTAGEGTEISPANPDILISTLVGLPKIIDNGVMVDKVYQLNHVDVGSGHIKFEGSVVISGDVKENMKVIASGDITVAGFVESAYLDAGGDITIQKGIIGHKYDTDNVANLHDIKMSAQINAKGNIYATYAQYSQLNAIGNVRIENQLMHSAVKAQGHLWVGKDDTANGKLIGGIVKVQHSVHAGVIGAAAGSKTVFDFNNKIDEFKHNISEVDEKIQEENQKAHELHALAKKMKELPPNAVDADVLTKVISTFKHHSLNIATYTKEKESIEETLLCYMESVYVEATEKAFHGIEIHIGEESEYTKREYGPIKLHYAKRNIHIDPIINH